MGAARGEVHAHATRKGLSREGGDADFVLVQGLEG